MRSEDTFRALDPNQYWYEQILEKHLNEAKPLCDRLLADTEQSDNGCLVTATTKPRKVRFRGGQDRAYRFIFCVANHLAPTRHQVVRHRCHNRRCLNPAHLELGDRMENLLDERERQANGVDYSLL